jgi:hypothetical protein
MERKRGAWFVREIHKANQWDDLDADLAAIAVDVFGKNDPASVFLVHSERQEARVLAALKLGRSVEAGELVRFTVKEARRAGLRIDRQEGKTGIPSIDALHCDLIGGTSEFASLTGRIIRDHMHGTDRIRKVSRNRLGIALVELRRKNGIPEAARKKLDQWIAGLEAKVTKAKENASAKG